MTTAKNRNAEQKLRRARSQPNLAVTRFDPTEVLRECCRQRFPGLTTRVACYFADEGPLACIVPVEESGVARIYLHNVLNHGSTPGLVVRHLLIHELIHLVLPPRETDGCEEQHPPDFWRVEDALSPEAPVARSWLCDNVPEALLIGAHHECVPPKRSSERCHQLQLYALDDLLRS